MSAATESESAAFDEAEIARRAAEIRSRLSDAQANTIYTAAFRLSEKGNYQDASSLLRLLGVYRPNEPKYAYAAGICFRKLGRYEEAIPVLGRAMELRPDDYAPAFLIIECMMLLGRREEALNLLQIIAAAAVEYGQPQTVERATALIDFIEGAAQ
jgi:tetratricopeptide (TPR) repeat protein